MDPFTLNRFALVRQQELLEMASRDPNDGLFWRLLALLGRFLAAVGRKVLKLAAATSEKRAISEPVCVENGSSSGIGL